MIKFLRLGKYGIGNYKISVLLAIFFSITEIALGFAIPYLTVEIIDKVIPNQDWELFSQLIILMVSCALLGLLLSILNNINAQKAAQFGTADLRLNVFSKIQYLSFRNVDKYKSGRLISSVTNDISQIRQFYAMGLTVMIRAPFYLIGGLVMAFLTSKDLAVIFLVMVPILVLLLILVMKLAVPYFAKMQKNVDEINTVSVDNVNAPRVFKSFVTEEIENEKFQKINNNYAKTAIRAQQRLQIFPPFANALITMASAFVLILGASLIANNIITAEAGKFLVFTRYSAFIGIAVMIFGMMFMTGARAFVSAKRIMEILDEEITIKNKENPIKEFELQGNIEFKDVLFRYVHGGKYVLENISFTINQGETIGLIGSTGSGKSSLVKMIPRLYDTSDGQVLLDGKDVKEYELTEIRNQIGMVTQEAIIFSGDIKKNILQGNKKATDEEINNAVLNSLADEFIKSKEDGLSSKVEQRGTNLSGGQKQRLSLARAMVKNPKILILDDVTSALDAKSEKIVLDNIQNNFKNTTKIIISQKISSIMNVDKILVLDNYGNIDGYDNHDNLLKTSEVYKGIYASQFGGIENE